MTKREALQDVIGLIRKYLDGAPPSPAEVVRVFAAAEAAGATDADIAAVTEDNSALDVIAPPVTA